MSKNYLSTFLNNSILGMCERGLATASNEFSTSLRRCFRFEGEFTCVCIGVEYVHLDVMNDFFASYSAISSITLDLLRHKNTNPEDISVTQGKSIALQGYNGRFHVYLNRFGYKIEKADPKGNALFELKESMSGKPVCKLGYPHLTQEREKVIAALLDTRVMWIPNSQREFAHIKVIPPTDAQS